MDNFKTFPSKSQAKEWLAQSGGTLQHILEFENGTFGASRFALFEGYLRSDEKIRRVWSRAFPRGLAWTLTFSLDELSKSENDLFRAFHPGLDLPSLGAKQPAESTAEPDRHDQTVFLTIGGEWFVFTLTVREIENVKGDLVGTVVYKPGGRGGVWSATVEYFAERDIWM